MKRRVVHTVVLERPTRYIASIESAARVYGRTLRWTTNDERLETAIGQLIERWKSVDVPTIGGTVFASAMRVPVRNESPRAVGHAMNNGVLLVTGSPSFSFLASDQKSATTVIADDLDADIVVERLIEPVWFGLFTKPPLYGLHAGAVAQDDRATLFLGGHGSGKSTLVAGLTRFAGSDYLSDDIVLLDGRDLRVYGRPWRVELREPSWLVILPPDVVEAGRPHHAKRYWDGRVVFEGRFASSAMPARLCFVERGNTFDARPLSPVETQRRLGAPIAMYERRRTRAGYRNVFDRLCSSLPGYVITVDHSQGVARTVAAVAEWLGR